LLRHDADVTVAALVRAASGRSAHARSASRADRMADAEEAVFIPLAFGRPNVSGLAGVREDLVIVSRPDRRGRLRRS
jgi:hypothetical protein